MEWLFLFLIQASSALATYNVDCLRLLRPPVPRFIQEYHRTMIAHVHTQKFAADLNPLRLESMDYEVIYDVTHGLPLRAVFADGSRHDLASNSHSLEILRDKLIYSNVMVAMYSAPALEKIRYIMKNACIATEHLNCDAYDHYIGLMDNSSRPFNRREEQALKWATIYHLPLNATATVLRQESRSPGELREKVDAFRKARLASSYSLLKAAFSEVRAAEIYELFVANYLSEAFDRLENLAGENVVVLRR